MAKFSSIVEKVILVLLVGGPVAGVVFGGLVGRRYDLNRALSSSIGFVVGFGISLSLLVLLMAIERLLMRSRDKHDVAKKDVTERKR